MIAQLPRKSGKTTALLHSIVAEAIRNYPKIAVVGLAGGMTAERFFEQLEECGYVVSIRGNKCDGLARGNLPFRVLIQTL